jgi:uncharacterized protein (TIGR02453 family)
MFTPDAFAFFVDLAQHNDRTWFAANKSRYDAQVKTPFTALLQAASLRLDGTAVPYAGGPDTLFRIHRDTRFAHDKSPYKTNMGGLLTPTGRKDMGAGMVYVHLDADGGFVASGVYMPDPPRLAGLRDRMVRAPDAFLGMVATLAARGLTLSDEGSLTRMPKGYDAHADTPLAPHLRRKSLIVREPIPASAYLDGSAADLIAAHAQRAAPLLAFCRV